MMKYPINEKYIKFYIKYFNNSDKSMELLNRCYHLTEINVFPRQLVNQLARTMIFADHAYDNVYGNRSFQVFIWMALIESYEYILNPEMDSEKVDKLGVILKFFRTYLSESDHDLLVRHLRRSIIDTRFESTTEYNAPQCQDTKRRFLS